MPTTSRVPLRHLLAASAVTVVGVLWTLTRPGPDAVAYVFMPVGGLAGLWSVGALLRTVRLEPAARRFWQLLLAGVAGVTAGYLILAVVAFDVSPVLPAIPVPAAALAGGGLLVAMWAVARVPLGVTGTADRRKQLLDRVIAFVGGGTLLWSYSVAPMVVDRAGWSTPALVLVGLTCVVGLGALTKVSYIAGGPVDAAALRLVAATALTAVGITVLSRHGDGGTLLAQAVVMPAVFVLIALAVRRQWSATSPRPRRTGVWLPYLSVLAVDVSLVGVLRGGLSWPDRVVVIAVVVLTVLVGARQLLIARENRRLVLEKRDSEQRLRHEVTHDGLTGLANRGLFRERVAAVLDGGEATVLLVDLDDFKTVNDSLGHDVGDALLIAVADALRAAVGPLGLAVRLGGDEFAVVLTEPQADGEDMARRILEAFAGPMSAHRLLVHASLGIATGAPGTAPDALLRHADVAMYAAKQRGKANWVRYHDGMDHPVLAHARLGGELRRALDAGEFRVHYQPIVALAADQVIGVESLVRWEHPTRGLVPPAEFIPAAESTGLIVPLGRFVLRETCRQAAAWLAEFGPDALQKAGPNVSVRQLHDPDFVADVRAALADSGLPADRLVLELTESAVLRGGQVSAALRELHDMGVRLALDDFGTGESSLSLLRAFPASIVKLDKSFVDGIELDEPGTAQAAARQAVARAVVQMAGALGLDTVAEGIENQEQAERLRQLGYHLGQGYHLARPMPADQMTRLLADGRRSLAVAA